MAEAPIHVVRETGTLRFARFIVRNRAYVAILLIAFSLFFFYPIFNMIMTTLGSPLPQEISGVSCVRNIQRAGDVFCLKCPICERHNQLELVTAVKLRL